MTTTVLLYSGGLDSYCLARVRQPDVLLHVDMATRYGAVEAERLNTPPGWHGRLERAHLPLAQWERDDAIIPGRNAHLVLLAANYGDTIWLAATAGDRVNDKDETFAQRANMLLDHLYAPQWWLPQGRPVLLQLPIKQWSKVRLVREYLTVGGDPAALATGTVSCYQPSHDGAHCGACKPCARKWVALVVNDVDPGYNAEAYVRATYLTAIRDGSWDRGEDEAADVMAALREAS